MDLVLALMPIKFVRSLTRPMREKILIGCLMALGLCATVIAGVKMTTFNDVGLGDPMFDTIKPSLYAKLEELVGIIAACTPCLKAPIEHLLKRFGILSEPAEITMPSFVATAKTQDDISLGSFQRQNTGGADSTNPDQDGASTSPIYSMSSKDGKVLSSETTGQSEKRRKEEWDVESA